MEDEYYSKEDKIVTSVNLSSRHYRNQRIEINDWFFNKARMSQLSYDNQGCFYSLTDLIEFKLLFGGIGPIDVDKIRPLTYHTMEDE